MNRDRMNAFREDFSAQRGLNGEHGGEREEEKQSHLIQVMASRDESLPSVIAWDPSKLPNEWQIRGRIIEAYNLPRANDDTSGSYVCCISLIQDLKGVAYQHYLCLDHSRVLGAKSSVDAQHQGHPCTLLMIMVMATPAH